MFQCDKCDAVLTLDYRRSTLFYNSNVTTILDKEGDFNLDTLPEEVVYSCKRCGSFKLVKLSDIIYGIKKKVADLVLDFRYGTVYNEFDKVVEESNGVDFCGMCYGVVDDSGYCYNDVINECPVRKILNDKKHFTKRGEYKE